MWMKWLAAALCALALVCFPALDLSVSSWFYDPARGFWLADTWPALLIYHGVRYAMWAIGIGLVAALIWAHLSRDERARRAQRPLWFLILVLVLGPQLITHELLKNNWGRPRPEAIAEFGGAGHYVRPGVISDQCEKNCSFTSGHAAAAFYLIAFAWVFPKQRRRWMLVGIIAGSVSGLVRIAQGGHFISDIFFSFWVVWLTATAVAWALNPQPPEADDWAKIRSLKGAADASNPRGKS
ncbi:MAG: phosphatase PAP2 family protein [Pseudomonadota bacterium]